MSERPVDGEAGIDSIASLQRRLRCGAITQRQIRQTVAAQMARHASLNAFITSMLDRAADVDDALPIAGVPVGIKDFFDTAGVRTTAAFEHFANRVPAEDATLVDRLKAAGALIVGKTNMHCLGMGTTSLDSHFGPVGNPRDRGRVAGGSSGGSAAAVAAGICLATIDTDAVGSARLPAACCGVVGFKPSFGVLSQEGVLRGEAADPVILALSHAAIIAKYAADVEIVFAVLNARESVRPVRHGIEPPRIAIATNFEATEAIRQAFGSVAPVVAALGDAAGKIEVPFAEARFDPGGIDAARKAINGRLFERSDLLLLPTLAAPVPRIDEALAAGDQAVSPANTFFANYFGLPAITVPVPVDDNAIPFGLQIVGPAGGDRAVLAFAKRVQEAFPPIFP